MRDDVCGSIRIDRQVHAWLQRGFGHAIRSSCVRGRAKQFFRHQPDAQNKCACTEHALKEPPPAAE